MKKILIAEDDHFLANAYRVKLEKSEFEVQIAGDGEQALKILETFTPDVIVLDLVMPVKDGFATLEAIKANEKWKDIPVIVASNIGQKEDSDRAEQLGAVKHIVKSNTPLQKIVDEIKNYA